MSVDGDAVDGHDHGGGVRECGKVRQLSGGVTVLREV